jgi:hypothetical protein
MLSSAFVSGIRQGGGSVLLVEAKAATQQPLVLEIWQGTNLVAIRQSLAPRSTT